MKFFLFFIFYLFIFIFIFLFFFFFYFIFFIFVLVCVDDCSAKLTVLAEAPQLLRLNLFIAVKIKQ